MNKWRDGDTIFLVLRASVLASFNFLWDQNGFHKRIFSLLWYQNTFSPLSLSYLIGTALLSSTLSPFEWNPSRKNTISWNATRKIPLRELPFWWSIFHITKTIENQQRTNRKSIVIKRNPKLRRKNENNKHFRKLSKFWARAHFGEKIAAGNWRNKQTVEKWEKGKASGQFLN